MYEENGQARGRLESVNALNIVSVYGGTIIGSVAAVHGAINTLSFMAHGILGNAETQNTAGSHALAAGALALGAFAYVAKVALPRQLRIRNNINNLRRSN